MFLGNSLTERTSTNRVFRLRRWRGRDLSTDSVERMEVQMRMTSGCCSQRSCRSEKKAAPSDCATEW